MGLFLKKVFCFTVTEPAVLSPAPLWTGSFSWTSRYSVFTQRCKGQRSEEICAVVKVVNPNRWKFLFVCSEMYKCFLWPLELGPRGSCTERFSRQTAVKAGKSGTIAGKGCTEDQSEDGKSFVNFQFYFSQSKK